MAKKTKPDIYSEWARRACSNELYGKNALIDEYFTAYTLTINQTSRNLENRLKFKDSSRALFKNCCSINYKAISRNHNLTWKLVILVDSWKFLIFEKFLCHHSYILTPQWLTWGRSYYKLKISKIFEYVTLKCTPCGASVQICTKNATIIFGRFRRT